MVNKRRQNNILLIINFGHIQQFDIVFFPATLSM